MDIHTSDTDFDGSAESISTPEELKERQRLKDIATARRTARESFKEQSEAEVRRLYRLATAGEEPLTEAQVSNLTDRHVYRHVAAYVEELAYHLQTTEVGKHYWSEVRLGEFSVRWPDIDELGIYDTGIDITKRQLGLSPAEVTVQGLSGYLDQETYTRTTERGGKTIKAERPVPAIISRRAFRATNNFAEELLGLELTQEKNTVYNISLGSDGEQANTNGSYE